MTHIFHTVKILSKYLLFVEFKSVLRCGRTSPCEYLCNTGCWSPKCNNCPKGNEVLNVITFGPKCNKVLNVISLQCNRLTPSVHCCYGGHPHWDVKVTAVALKKTADQYTCHITGSLISISVFLLARHRKYQQSKYGPISGLLIELKKIISSASGLALGWKLNRMESIDYNWCWTRMLLLMLSFVLKSLLVMHHFRAVLMISLCDMLLSVNWF